MIELLGHIPRQGEKVQVGEHIMTALRVETTRIHRLRIERTIESRDEETGDP